MKKLASFTKYAQKNVKLQKFHNLINIHEMTSQSHEGNFLDTSLPNLDTHQN